MKVLLVTHYSALKYGANLSLHNLVKGSTRSPIEYHVIAPREGALLSELRNDGIAVEAIPFPLWMNKRASTGGRVKRFLQSIFSAKKIAGYAKANGIDIIHSNSTVINTGLFAAKFAKVPHLWHLREFGNLDHGFEPDLGWPMHRYLMKQSRATIAVSHSVQAHHLGNRKSRYSKVILNGVLSEQRFAELARQKQTANPLARPFTFIIIGHIFSNKGQLTALQALNIVRQNNIQANLQIVGDGDDEYIKICKHYISENGMQDIVSFKGYQADPFPFYLSSDAALLCSPKEAMGRVTVEAMAASLPVIGVDSGGTQEMIQNNITGILVPNQAAAFADGMSRLAKDHQLSRKMGAAAHDWARVSCSVEHCCASVHTLYDEMLSHRS